MFCYEIFVRSTGKVDYFPKITLCRFGIEVGGGGRNMPSTFISANKNLRSRLTDPDAPQGDHHNLIEAEIVMGGHDKPLLVESWTSALLDDHALVLCHVASSGKGVITPNEQVTTWAHGQRWKNPRPANYASLGVIAERLMVMKRDSAFTWKQVSKHGKETTGTVIYDGRGQDAPFRFVGHTALKATG